MESPTWITGGTDRVKQCQAQFRPSFCTRARAWKWTRWHRYFNARGYVLLERLRGPAKLYAQVE